MHLTVILPAYNEESRIEAGVDAVASFLDAQDIEGEVLVVNDGSTDRTGELLEQLAQRQPRLRAISFDTNRGKGAAVRRGVDEARGDFILFTDVDQSTPIEEWLRLEERLLQGHDVVLASREVVGAERVIPQPWMRRAMGYLFMTLRGWIVLPGFIDTQCGFKAFRRDVAKQVFSRALLDGFCFDVEILAIAVHLGHNVIEVPVRWRDDPRSTVNPLRDSFDMFGDLFTIRRNRARGLYD